MQTSTEETRKMTTEELAELFLAHLYDLAEAAPHPYFLFSVNDFAPRYGVMEVKELQAALHYLGDRGLIIVASVDIRSGISAGITMDGCVFVEKGGETGIIGRYRENPEAFVTEIPEISSEPLSVQPAQPPSSPQPRQFYPDHALEGLLFDIEDFLRKDSSLTDELGRDLASDVATLKIQVSRNVKNKPVIRALLGNLSTVPSIAPLVRALDCIVDAYVE